MKKKREGHADTIRSYEAKYALQKHFLEFVEEEKEKKIK